MKKLCVYRFRYRALSSSQTPLRSFSSLSSDAVAKNASVPVKQVKKSNFESSLERLRSHVRAADFVSIDLEMTGVTSAPWRESLPFDRSDVRYLKVKDSAEKFAIVQFGVCPFRWDPLNDSFIAHPHNFYIFPRKELPIDGPSYEFLCQTTSMEFLAKYQFDFNSCIHEGISYLSRAQELEALHLLGSECIEELANSEFHISDGRDIPLKSTFDILFTERMKNTFSEWRDGLLRHSNEGCRFEDAYKGAMPRLQTIFFKMRPALKLNGFTSHQLKLIRLVVSKHFQDLVYVWGNDENSSAQKLILYTDSGEDRVLLMKEVKQDLCKEIERKIKAAVGVRHVIDLLVSEQKLIVGHNCFLDIAHIYSKFVGSLPSTIEEFASKIHSSFPYIVDTKHLMKHSVIQHLTKKSSKSLSSIFALLCPQVAYGSKDFGVSSRPYVKVEAQVDDLRLSNWNSGAKHEAGYDAFMTGCVFAQICSHLGVDFKLQLPSMELAKNERLQKYINLLYLSWNSGTLIDLSTGSEIPEAGFHNQTRRHPKIVFDNVVLVWGFSSKLKPQELKECICKVFGLDSVTSVYYLDGTAVFIQFSKTEFVSDFLALKDSLEKRNDPISVLHPLAKLLEGGTTHSTSYEIYKEICSSPISKVLFADQAEAVGISFGTAKMDSVKVDMEKLDADAECSSKNTNLESVDKSTSNAKGKLQNNDDSFVSYLGSLYNHSLIRKQTTIF